MGNESLTYVPNRDHYATRCKFCGFEVVKRPGLPSGLGVTKVGSYGANTTPSPATHSETYYTASTISFTAATASEPAKINDSALQFAEQHLKGGMTISITSGSALNDGNYTIADDGVTREVLSLVSTDSLTTETAAAAGEVVIKRRMYKPSVATGCAFCGSLNNRDNNP